MAVTDLLGGQISLVFADISTTLPQIRARQVKGFGVSSTHAQPSRLTCDHGRGRSRGLRADRLVRRVRSGQDAEAIVDKLNAAMNAALADKAVQDTLLSAGVEPLTSTRRARACSWSRNEEVADIVKPPASSRNRA